MEAIELLITILKRLKIGKEQSLQIISMVDGDEMAMEDLSLWIHENQPTFQQILKDWMIPYLSKKYQETNKKEQNIQTTQH